MATCFSRTILSISLLTLTSTAYSQIHLIGPQSGILTDTTYIVDGDMSVQEGDSLIIMPGATFLFNDSCGFDIQGYLYAVGNEQDSIRFEANLGVSAWSGIDFWDASDDSSRLGYSTIIGSNSSGVSCTNSSPIISRCTITRNIGIHNGGGIYCDSSCATIDQCTISRNSTNPAAPDIVYGGGIYCHDSNPTIRQCIISENRAGFENTACRGGGIACVTSSPIIIGCTISGNRTEAVMGLLLPGFGSFGGGITCNENSNPIVEDCLITENTATCPLPFGELGGGGGGGISISASSPVISNSTISLNYSQTEGGGIHVGNGTPIINNCIINENSSYYDGGGISTDANLTLRRCVISGNSTQITGGGMKSGWYDNSVIENCTFYGNSASSHGGGISCSRSSVEVINSIVEGNSGNGGAYFYQSPDAFFAYCDFHNNEGGNFTGSGMPHFLGQIVTTNANGDSCDTYFNIFLDPMFVDTLAEDYHLLANSHCIDAGDPESPLDPDSTIADIGAFYYHQSAWIRRPGNPVQPFAYYLLQNYPNPFNLSTRLGFILPVASEVKLRVYDITGRVITTMLNGWQQSGSHEVTFSGVNLASGVYFYRLEAGEYSEVHRMILLK